VNFTRCTPATCHRGEGVKLLRNFTPHPAGSLRGERLPQACVVCGDSLPFGSRADRKTCSMRCHVAAWRARRAAKGSESGDGATVGVRKRSTPATVVTSAAGIDGATAQGDDQDRQVDDGGGASPPGTVAA
jgi:hypothetical protein